VAGWLMGCWLLAGRGQTTSSSWPWCGAFWSFPSPLVGSLLPDLPSRS
jgi:hypothetical protein